MIQTQPGIQSAFPWAEYQPGLEAIDNTPEPLPDWGPDPEAIGLRVVASYKVKP